MTGTYAIDLYGIGPVVFNHSRRAKRIILSIKPFIGVRVAVPTRVPFKKAEEFAFSKVEWIKQHLEKMKLYEKEREIFQDRSSDIDRADAKETLTSRLEDLAEKHGFTYDKVAIRSQRTRWGSCSRSNNISLNIKLVKLPDELRDYVILHELVHTRVHNHGEEFWAELNNYVGDARAAAKRLKTAGLRLLAR